MRTHFQVLVVLLLSGFIASVSRADTDFTQWSGIGGDDNKTVVSETIAGKHAVRLVRKKEGAEVRIEQNVTLKPQTLYRFAVTGSGAAKAAMRLRPASSKDKDFAGLYKAWATSSAPMPASEKPVESELIFDSGLKADSAGLSIYLDGKAPGEYVVQQVTFTEIGSSKPNADEKIILHLGDSITITSYLPFEQRIETLLRKQLPESTKAKVRQINYGVDGEYVRELIDTRRYHKVVEENLERVDIVVIRYGANDSRHGTPADFSAQLDTLCDFLRRRYPNVVVILGTGPYLNGNKDVNKKYGPYWQAARDLAKERNYPLVDVYNAFEKAASDKLCRGPGDMHPSAAGVEVIAGTTFNVLRDLLK